MIKTKIYGAPGTGKTTRMLELLQLEIASGTPVDRIAFVTHTVAARREAVDRTGMPEKDLKYFRTIHGICYSQIGIQREQVMQSNDYLQFADDTGIKFSVNFTKDVDMDGLPFGYQHSIGNEILAVRQMAAAKMCRITEVIEEYPDEVNNRKMQETLELYREWKWKNVKFDFVDMLQMYMRSGDPVDIDVMFIDEGQDLSMQQWAIVDKMMKKCKRVYIAGDDDQSIYAFIGADRYGFLDYQTEAKEILPKTWRLRDNIWRMAQKIISGVAKRQPKDIATRGEGGEIEYYNCHISHIPINPKETTMFISRHNGQLDDLAEELTQRGIPFEGRGWQPYGSSAVRSIHAYLALREGKPVLLRDAATVLDRLGRKGEANALRGRGRKDPALTVAELPGVQLQEDWVRYLARSATDVTKNQLIRSIINSVGWAGVLEPPKVSLATYHGAKGRQAFHVVLLTDCYRKAYDSARRDPDDERRVAYVGVTRAQERLSIVLPQSDLYMRSLL